MIIDIPEVTSFGQSWSNLKIQWETVHTPPLPKDSAGTGNIFFDSAMLQRMYEINGASAFQWMAGGSGTIIWRVLDRKHPTSILNKLAFMPVIAIGKNKLHIGNDVYPNHYRRVYGMTRDDFFTMTPETNPEYWHRIWCVTKQAHGKVSAAHDTPKGIAYLPILDPLSFRCSKALAGGVIYYKVSA